MIDFGDCLDDLFLFLKKVNYIWVNVCVKKIYGLMIMLNNV